MKLNRYDIQKYFHGEVCAFAYQPLMSSTDFFFPNVGIQGIRLDKALKPQERTLEIEFWDEKDISRFTAELIAHDVNTLNLDDGYLYDVVYRGGNAVASQVWNSYYTVSYPVYAIQKGHLVRTKLKRKSNFLRILGTWEAPCKISITPDKDIDVFSINDITVKNLKQGETFVIDGINKLVEVNGENRFTDTNIKKFPSFAPGDYVITLSELVDVVIEYYPIYM